LTERCAVPPFGHAVRIASDGVARVGASFELDVAVLNRGLLIMNGFELAVA